MSAPILATLKDVCCRLPGGDRDAIQDVTLTIYEGEHCALLGDNGSGKTTLLRLLRGDVWATTGRIAWMTDEGEETSPIAGRSLAAIVSPLQQGVYQRQQWLLTGLELLLTGFDDTPLLYGSAPDHQKTACVTLAKSMGITALLDRSLPSLSQGQLRLLLLGRALVWGPKLLLLDECTDGLDKANRQKFWGILESFANSHTIIMAEHRLANIPSWCTHRYWLDHGKLRKNVPQYKKSPTTKVRTATAPHLPEDGRLLVSLDHVDVYVDREQALYDITWDMHQGEHWRIAGANGSGKSTLLRLLAGDEMVASGGHIRRWMPGRTQPLRTLLQVRKAYRLVADLSQAQYDYDVTVLELLCSGIDNTVGLYRSFAASEEAKALHALKTIGLAELADRTIDQLSTGQLRRVFLARAIMGNPSILLLDEPCSGLDAASRTQYLDTLDKLAETGMHIIIVTHYDEDVPLCVNRHARMDDGRLIVTS
ncbi:MAG: ATP-binding cassette domain-containing protein [Desulfovibrio sp.]|jgi:molybdate transport system ATP-binding protein|nr:ATP-binding cassette domain-containing protein [Desulfovibrio sp.]